MKRAFLRNAKAASALQGSHGTGKGMLLFYSAECGLKYLIMIDNGYKTTQEVSASGHNLRKLLQDAKIGPSELKIEGELIKVPDVKVAATGDLISCSDWHTAWRYGVDMHVADDLAAASFLDNVISALKMRINR